MEEENVPENDNRLKPLLVTWSHGSLRPESASKLKCTLFSKIDCPQKILGLGISQNDKMYLSKPDQSPYCNNFLVVRNKNTNSIRIYETESFLMSPSETPVTEISKDTSLNTDEAEETSLNKVLGSKRIKRRIIEIEKINAQVDNIEKKIKKDIAENKLIVPSPSETPDVKNDSVIPPCNRNAPTVEQVYKITDIIPTEILDFLEDKSKELLECTDSEMKNDERFSPFFWSVFSKILKPDPVKVKLLMYADILVNFLKFPAKKLMKANPVIYSYSELINTRLICEYTTVYADGRRSRPPSARDRVFCHMLILLMYACGFTFDISLLAGEMAIQEYRKLPLLLRVIGARPDRGSRTVFCLKLPLVSAPEPKIKKLKSLNR